MSASTPRPSRLLPGALEIVAAVAVAIGTVALLRSVAELPGLNVVPLLVVLWLAVRRGQRAALLAAVLNVAALNFIFVRPEFQLTLSDDQNDVALAVFLIAAVVVGQVAELSRARAREAELLAAVAARLVGQGRLADELPWIGERIALALGARAACVDVGEEPGPRPIGARTIALRLREAPARLYVAGGSDASRLARPLAGLLDLALERERLAVHAAEAEAARRADVAKTAVLRALSHDLRSPLTAITTAGDALADPALAPAAHGELVSVVRTEARRLARVVGDLLDLSRIQAGAAAPREDWTDLRDVVVGAVDGVRAQHRVELDVPATLPLVRADAAQLERVLANLLENAVRFSPAGAAVRVRAAVRGDVVVVEVANEGPPIPPAERDRVFEPFVRGAGSRGAGLGLAIARGFTEANGGTIAAGTGAAGETVFAVTLPVAELPAEAMAA